MKGINTKKFHFFINESILVNTLGYGYLLVYMGIFQAPEKLAGIVIGSAIAGLLMWNLKKGNLYLSGDESKEIDEIARYKYCELNVLASIILHIFTIFLLFYFSNVMSIVGAIILVSYNAYKLWTTFRTMHT